MRHRGLVYRAHNPYWSFSPLSGEGARQDGGRFNPKGTAALYTSLTETVALAEYHQGFPRRPQPATLCAYEVDCADIADLTDAATRSALHVQETDLSCPWEWLVGIGQQPPSWVLAARLIQQGLAGIVVPSFAVNAPPNGKNLVFWRWDNVLPHQVVLIDDDERLPRNQESWQGEGE